MTVTSITGPNLLDYAVELDTLHRSASVLEVGQRTVAWDIANQRVWVVETEDFRDMVAGDHREGVVPVAKFDGVNEHAQLVDILAIVGTIESPFAESRAKWEDLV